MKSKDKNVDMVGGAGASLRSAPADLSKKYDLSRTYKIPSLGWDWGGLPEKYDLSKKYDLSRTYKIPSLGWDGGGALRKV